MYLGPTVWPALCQRPENLGSNRTNRFGSLCRAAPGGLDWYWALEHCLTRSQFHPDINNCFLIIYYAQETILGFVWNINTYSPYSQIIFDMSWESRYIQRHKKGNNENKWCLLRFWNVLYLDLDGVTMGVYTCKTSSSYILKIHVLFKDLKIMQCILCFTFIYHYHQIPKMIWTFI